MTPPLSIRLAALVAAGILAFAPMAGADGGLWVRQQTADDGHSADQRAILVYDASTSTETLLVTTKYRGAPADFAWVLPVPSLPDRTQVGTCPEATSAFEALSQSTAPRATQTYSSGGGCRGCAPSMSSGTGEPSAATADVDVVDRLSISGLDISLLDARAGSDLAEWLNGNGYRFPAEGTAVAQDYVEQGWKFVAVKVDVAEERARRDAAWDAYFPGDPLRLTFHSEQMLFPMRISSLSTGTGGARVLLYVFADHRVKVATYPTVDAQAPSGVTSAAQFPAAYESAFRQLIEQPAGRAFVTEYARPATDPDLVRAGVLSDQRAYFLTRLRTVLRTGDMVEDVVLADAGGDAEQDVQVHLSASGRAPGTLLPLAAVTACFGARRRRGLAPSLAAKEALLLGLLLLGACLGA